jgi:methylmalonyl-CoA carboxyltransferase small subunit
VLDGSQPKGNHPSAREHGIMKLRITIDDKTYDVDVEVAEDDPRPRLPAGVRVEPSPVRVPAAGASPPEQAAPGGPIDEEKVCRSRITGTVVKVVAQPGQSIQPGDTLLVLEAMKMETNITAPVAGRVRTVTVAPGDGVKAGQVVVELE